MRYFCGDAMPSSQEQRAKWQFRQPEMQARFRSDGTICPDTIRREQGKAVVCIIESLCWNLLFCRLKICGNHSRETAKQIACRHNPHSGYPKGAHGFRRRKQSQNLCWKKDDGQCPQYHHTSDQSGSVSESGMQPFAVACAVVKPHDRQTALDQAVYRHNNQLLHLKSMRRRKQSPYRNTPPETD